MISPRARGAYLDKLSRVRQGFHTQAEHNLFGTGTYAAATRV